MERGPLVLLAFGVVFAAVVVAVVLGARVATGVNGGSGIKWPI